MAEPQERAAGTWPSPISAQAVAASHGSIAWVEQVGGALWWVESDPFDDGALALFREGEDGATRLTPPGANVRNRVHEYGGLPWASIPCDEPEAPHAFCYTEWSDHRIYRQTGSEAVVALTPVADREAGFRYAEPRVVGGELLALREHYFGEAPTDVTRDFVAIPLDGSAADDGSLVRVLGAGEQVGGHHFLAGLRVSPDGSHAAWIGWNHPFMPWDRSELMVAEIENGVFVRPRALAGGVARGGEFDSVSVCQVEWDDDGRLVYLSDETGWWNLYRRDPLAETAEAVLTVKAELGGALWRPGLRWFAPLGGGRYGVLNHGVPSILDAARHSITPIDGTTLTGLPLWRAHLSAVDGRLASVGYGPFGPPRLVSSRVGDRGSIELHGDQPTLSVDRSWLPTPELTWFSARDGASIPANVYQPTNPGVRLPAGELAPFIVHIHGGPTGENSIDLDLEIAYYTSRGIGVVAPEYGGSTGFGRAWRERLNGQWGVVDLLDAESVALGLVEGGLADPARLGIRGGSAGGFTSVLALTRQSVFAVGLARYPVIDLVAFANGETHDLESQYLAGLIGPLPDAAALYRERSPVNAVADIHGPLLILQGLDDRICLPAATERFVDALLLAGKPHRYVAYAGEQHGFRRAETIADAIAAEFAYFCDAVGIPTGAAETPAGSTT